MTQRTRNIIANVLLGVSIVLIAAFVAQHYMTPLRPSWHTDLAWLGIAGMIASRLVRGRASRRAIST